MKQTLKVKFLRDGATLPKKATAGAAAFDLFALLPDSDITVPPKEIISIPTGIAIELPSPAYVALLFARSGLAVKHGIALINSVGVIDSDYRGEIAVVLINHGSESYTFKNGDRIAQLMVTGVADLDIEPVAELTSTERGEGGFGSTGMGKQISRSGV